MRGIKEIVRGLQCKYNTCDPRILIDCLGFFVVDKPLEDCFGVMVRCGSKVIISASTLQPAPVRRYAYGHELGHAVLHRGLDVCFMEKHRLWSINKVERQANVFCALLLLPDGLLKEYRNYSIATAAAELEVPKRLLEMRLNL